MWCMTAKLRWLGTNQNTVLRTVLVAAIWGKSSPGGNGVKNNLCGKRPRAQQP